MARDDSARLRALTAELGFTSVKMPNRDTWRLIDTVTAKAAINPAIEAEGFRTAAAIRFLQKLKRERSREERGRLAALVRKPRLVKRS
jgi:hypothetical protein